MKAGEFADGSRVLRAKIDMSSGNINMRDPVMYRILHTPPHHSTGSKWCIYPMYDFAHGQSDSIEGVTHSLCSLEYEDHRPLYDWFLDKLEIFHPSSDRICQIEFKLHDHVQTEIDSSCGGRIMLRDGMIRGCQPFMDYGEEDTHEPPSEISWILLALPRMIVLLILHYWSTACEMI